MTSQTQSHGPLLAAKQVDVILATMPFASLECPSAALGVLKASLSQAGISCEAVYANLLFTEFIGVNAYRFLNIGHRYDMIGDWAFAGAAFPGFEPDMSHHLEHLARYFCRYYERQPGPDSIDKMTRMFGQVRQQAGRFVDELAQAIVAKGPKVVGCSSSFEQHVASLALLRRVRELAPAVVTIIGGANCEDAMGLATVHHFPWLDIAFSGEADSIMAQLCGLLIAHGRHYPAEALPEGAIDRRLADRLAGQPRERRQIPRLLTSQLDAMPVPDYGEFLETLGRIQAGARIVPGLMLETSRGCWWGRCTFCGLNGCGNRYRSKSPGRIIDEIETLAQRFGVRRFGLTDTVISKAFWKEVLPRLAQADAGDRCQLFFETRSNLDRQQVELLAAAGVRWVQPGIEGLHPRMLALMDKGVGVMDNVRMLRLCRQAGIFVIWHLLVGFPGEDDAWHQETARWLPLIHHLQPVQGVKRIRYDRFCQYQQDPAAHGLAIEPFEAYGKIYPLSGEALADLAYYFRDSRPGRAYHRHSPAPAGVEALRRCQGLWHAAFFGKRQASLTMDDDGQRIVIADTRPCAPQARLALEGLEARALRACDQAGDLERIATRLERAGAAADQGQLAQALASLARRKLVLALDGQYLGLATNGPPPALPTRESFPMGSAPIPLVDYV
ncbi:Radical SAM domain protein [Desulfarculus baarsii DSM 2075]|uniref:Radical SAM domain protein n=1 Tax=Desulfarculus baarsii (strain ATCC 33931 / DSM 2075 / LMG 7858 / VKM B-1802 / 2st14) TaxID=644282 RepID=E1QJW3_DESB2|nr:RiPP maturation radical SAM C-methyltransferase [Desulfarculus baarsii]ADK85856.1 Radical SAM domain protein [Desulfarculus baarsii DSM 2075]